RDAAAQGRNTPRERWKRALYVVRMLHDPDKFLKGVGVTTDAEEKELSALHWLELID
ncbi:hypothetical protein AMATHDRAFT_101348, partial [Amanita thiersii Skay4041]